MSTVHKRACGTCGLAKVETPDGRRVCPTCNTHALARREKWHERLAPYAGGLGVGATIGLLLWLVLEWATP